MLEPAEETLLGKAECEGSAWEYMMVEGQLYESTGRRGDGRRCDGQLVGGQVREGIGAKAVLVRSISRIFYIGTCLVRMRILPNWSDGLNTPQSYWV